MLVNVIDIEVLLFRGNKSGGSYVTRTHDHSVMSGGL